MHRITLILVFVVSLVSLVSAQHHDVGATTSPAAVDLGKIDFPTSAPAAAQKYFIDGVLLLHSFEYARAQKAFAEASKIAPDFALAYWGEAMTYDHRIWGEQNRPAALAVLARLAPTATERRAKAPTEREKMYLDAVEKLYEDGDERQVAAAYSNAMAELAKRFPDDLEAQAFYSLSILGLTGTVRNTDNYMKAAAIAEEIYKKNPLHPGALHYLIHSYDDPAHASMGLRAARAYGTVARSASHAQHMPSHIYFALGLWEDSIAANTASMKTARDAGGAGYHPLHWLEHSYLQLGRTEEAAKLVAIVEDDLKKSASPSARTSLAMCRATFLVETRGAGPESMMSEADSAGTRSFGSFANHNLAIGLEYVRRNDLPGARRMLASLQDQNINGIAARGGETGGASRYTSGSQSDTNTGKVMENILDAAIQFAAGDRDDALKKIVAAAEAEDKLVFEYGPPAIVKPAWEQAGEMFLAAGKKSEAANAFRNVLKRYPNRRLSNEGLKTASTGVPVNKR
jgi:tetratricopeptide (TPR) repeat protein